MFERFTERARQAVVLAQDEARELGHDFIGTEHLLLGLLREEHGLAARTLRDLGLSLEDARARVEARLGRGESMSTGQIPFTPEAKQSLELGLREALSMGHDSIGTEHLLLGLARRGDASLAEVGLDAEAIRAEVLRRLGGPGSGEPRAPARALRRRPGLFHPVGLLVGGWLLFALALGAGILVGWAIWGT